MSQEIQPVQLQFETTQQFQAYVRDAETEMDRTEGESGSFLWARSMAANTKEIREGKVVAQYWIDSKPVQLSHGLIHDWVATACIPGQTIALTLRVMQDYDNHKNVYKPEVIDSKLLSRNGDQFHIYLRLLKKKIITVVLDTEHDVQYYSPGGERWCCRSHTTRIAEVEHSRTPKERVLPPDSGHGFLWRLSSYWRLENFDGAVWLQCRAISLTRDVPHGLGWIIDPIIRKLPRESLINTLEATRRALAKLMPALSPVATIACEGAEDSPKTVR